MVSLAHNELLKETQPWLKGISSSAIVVAAYILTMTCATRFTISGGNDDDHKPLFLHNAVFIFFAISAELTLFSS